MSIQNKTSIILCFLLGFLCASYSSWAQQQDEQENQKRQDSLFKAKMTKVDPAIAKEVEEASNYFERHRKEFSKYWQFSFGAKMGILAGKISEYSNVGGGADIKMHYGFHRFFVGIDLSVLASNLNKSFTLPTDYKSVDVPASGHIGLTTGIILGPSTENHFTLTLGLSYGFFQYATHTYRKYGNYSGQFNGFLPTFEVARSFKISKPGYSRLRTDGWMVWSDPNVTLQFLEVFAAYAPLSVLNDPQNKGEGKGSLFSIGLRWHINTYSIRENFAKN